MDSDTGIQFVARSTDYFVILAAAECAKCTSELVHIGKLALGSGSDTGICWRWLRQMRRKKELSGSLILQKKSNWH